MLATTEFGPALRLTLDRPEAGNALDGALLEALASALEQCDATAVLIDGGAGRFCTGLDLQALHHGRTGPEAYTRFAAILDRLTDMPALTIALVDGDALGGGLALAAACDVVVASERARFGLPEALWGLVPALAAPSVVRRAGPACARRLALSTEPLDATEAHRTGLVDHLASDRAAAEGTARRLALRAGRVGAEGLAAVKRVFHRLETDPAGYRDFALTEIAARGASPEVRARLDAMLSEEALRYGR